MELGTLQIQIFVSLVVVLGTAFVAFLCDFLKGNNEQLRERNIEMQVRQEEQQRFGVWEPAKLLKGIEALLKNTPALQHGAPPVATPAEAPLEPAQAPSWEQPAEPAAAKGATWASKEELEKLAERAARIRERHEARKATEETSESEAVTPTVLPVALAGLGGIAEAVAAKDAEAAPEQVEAALAAAETPPLGAETESVEQEPQAASAQSEAGGVLEWVTAESVAAESVTAEAAVAGELAEAEAAAVEAEAAAVEAEAAAVEAEAVAVEAEVPAIEPEAMDLEAEAPAIEAEAQAPEPEAPAIEAEADGSMEWAGEPVAGLQMALTHEIPQVAEPRLAELARVDEEAILAAQETPRLPEGELPLAPIEVLPVEAVEDVVELDAAELALEEAAASEAVEDEALAEPVVSEAEQGEAGGEPEFLRVRVLPIDQPVQGTEESDGAALEVDGRRLIAAPEAEAPAVEAQAVEAEELEAIEPVEETQAAELAEAPVAEGATEPAAEITSLHESLAKEEPGLPAGLHDVTLLRERMKANLNFEGVAVSIGINDYDALRQKLDTSAGAESMASVERLIQSMLKGSDFACRFQDDEFILLFPGEADSSAQRRLFQISEKLWDFQLRSLGHHSIMFSWGGLEVKRDTLSDAVASARERMFQTKRNRTGAIEMRKRVVNG